MTRKEANLEILSLLKEEVENFEDGRFWQILFNSGVIVGYPMMDGGIQIFDDYSRESVDILNRLKEHKL